MTRVLVLLALVACKQAASAPTPEEITDRAWTAHEKVVGAGEAQPTCAGAGAAMQKTFVENRQAFVEAMALDRDKAQLEQATAYIEAHEGRYANLETRMAALSDRCADDATVQAAFAQMSNP